jgi:RHS repeat-associated protein
VDAANGTPCARYEYGPFGEPLRITGPLAYVNPLRFSTKYTDDESGLLYFGYRYLNPSSGRWLSRDPIGENGGLNLYTFANGDAVNRFDYLGNISLLELEVVPSAIVASLNDKWHENCDYQRSSYENLLKDPKSGISTFWNQKTAGVKACSLPPIRCARCDVPEQGGYYDPTNRSITICENKLGKGGWTEFGILLRHELTHAAQHCCRWENTSCRDSVCMEIQAYAADGGGGKDLNKHILDGVRFSSRCACGKEVVKPWDDKKTCDQNIKGHEKAVQNKIQEVLGKDRLYDQCKNTFGNPFPKPEPPTP